VIPKEPVHATRWAMKPLYSELVKARNDSVVLNQGKGDLPKGGGPESKGTAVNRQSILTCGDTGALGKTNGHESQTGMSAQLRGVAGRNDPEMLKQQTKNEERDIFSN